MGEIKPKDCVRGLSLCEINQFIESKNSIAISTELDHYPRIKVNLEPISGPRAFGHARWR